MGITNRVKYGTAQVITQINIHFIIFQSLITAHFLSYNYITRRTYEKSRGDTMNLLLMANNGLPRNGLVALYDPYRDTYGRNILPVGSENFVTGWLAFDGSVQTITQNQTVAEWNTDKATRIQSTAGDGTSQSKYYTSVGTVGVLNAFYGAGCKVKNIGTNPVNIYFNSLGSPNYNITINPNEIIAIFVPQKVFDSYQIQVHFRADIPTNGFDIIAYQPQINIGTLYPYSPPAGLPQSLTDFSGHANNAQLGSTAGADTNDPAYSGQGLAFGTDDYCKSSSPAFDDLPQFTCITVAKANSYGVGSGGRVFDKDKRWLYMTSGQAIRFVQSQTSTSTYWSTPAVNYGTNYIYGLSFSTVSNPPNMYINAAKQSITQGGTGSGAMLSDASNDLYIGNGASAGNYWDGTIYLQAWYNRILSDAEYTQAYKYLKSLMNSRGVTI